jgi:hypothetical protein
MNKPAGGVSGALASSSRMRRSTLRKRSSSAIASGLGGWLALALGAALAAGPVRAGEFEFVVIGDTRPRFERQDFRPFQELIEKINVQKPSLVVNLGDLIYGYGPFSKEKQWDKYQAVIRAIQPPYYQVPGNHDTHSREARRIYERRFGRGYRSFDYQDCHFLLLDNSENGRWGYLGPAQLEWLKADLAQARARQVFVFMHFPVWEPERVTPEYYSFWSQTLHPLFKQSRVQAVFGGHYHSYGPTREFDGIRYFITGGGGAELRPEYRTSGGEHHFVRVSVTGDTFDVRVMTAREELTDAQADVMGGLLFAARNVSRIGIKRNPQDLKAGVQFSVSLANPYLETLAGQAEWVFDASAFSVEPQKVSLRIPEHGQQQQSFTLKTLNENASSQSLPRLAFNLTAGGRHHRFHREVRFLEEQNSPYRRTAPVLDGRLAEWEGVPSLRLGREPSQAAEIRACNDSTMLYLAVVVPEVKVEEDEELGFRDDLQVGMAVRQGQKEFGADFLRLGLSDAVSSAWNRTAGQRGDAVVSSVKSACRVRDGRKTYEVGVPLRLLKGLKAGSETRLVLDVSFQVPDSGASAADPSDPSVNTMAYRVRYGNDSLVPVYFVELTLEPKGR